MSPSPSRSGPGPAFRLREVSKRYGRTWGLRGVDLELPRGAVLALLGPNGAGKSTLLRLLAGVRTPTAGSGEVCGANLFEEQDRVRRHTALLPDSEHLYGDLTARENLRFAALMSGLPGGAGAGLERRSALERVGLAEVADERVRTFSAGMRKRLALARLLLRPASLVLMDEPYGHLDRAGGELVDRMVREFAEGGRSVVLATHRAAEATARADRVAVLRRGRVERTGPAAEGGRGGPDDEARPAEGPATEARGGAG